MRNIEILLLCAGLLGSSTALAEPKCPFTCTMIDRAEHVVSSVVFTHFAEYIPGVITDCKSESVTVGAHEYQFIVHEDDARQMVQLSIQKDGVWSAKEMPENLKPYLLTVDLMQLSCELNSG